jgi:uncharacterized protein YcbX
MGLAEGAGLFFDVAPIHLTTTAALAAVGRLRGSGPLGPTRFRPNLLLAPRAPAGPFPELDWLGRSIGVGPVTLRVIDPCPRCVVTTLAHGDDPAAPGLLRDLARETRATSLTLAPGAEFVAVVGIYATVHQSGELAVGDAVTFA